MNYKSEKVLSVMIKTGLIPASGTFDITYELIDSFFKIYGELFTVKGTGVKSHNIQYAKKLAGLNLLNLNKTRQNETLYLSPKRAKTMSIKSGFLYVISNPAFEKLFKIGITKDLNSRLSTYQTCDPFRRFKIEHYLFCPDVAYIEKTILDMYKVHAAEGEWVRAETGLRLYEDIKKLL